MPARTFRIHLTLTDPGRTDAQIQDEFDDLVTRACDGDRRALAAIAIAFSSRLLGEARAELGYFEQDADEVLQDFFAAVLERQAVFDPAKERANPWMKRILRELARRRRADRERDRGIEQ
jgi:uncharacterized protein (DUF2236 family)